MCMQHEATRYVDVCTLLCVCAELSWTEWMSLVCMLEYIYCTLASALCTAMTSNDTFCLIVISLTHSHLPPTPSRTLYLSESHLLFLVLFFSFVCLHFSLYAFAFHLHLATEFWRCVCVCVASKLRRFFLFCSTHSVIHSLSFPHSQTKPSDDWINGNVYKTKVTEILTIWTREMNADECVCIIFASWFSSDSRQKWW